MVTWKNSLMINSKYLRPSKPNTSPSFSHPLISPLSTLVFLFHFTVGFLFNSKTWFKIEYELDGCKNSTSYLLFRLFFNTY